MSLYIFTQKFLFSFISPKNFKKNNYLFKFLKVTEEIITYHFSPNLANLLHHLDLLA